MNDQLQDTQNSTILIVDDTPADLHLLSGLFKDQGFSVRAVPNGQLALQAAGKAHPDLILLDIQMPEMDGFRVCELFKADKELRHIPILFISVMDETLDKVKGFKVGGADYITKPFEFEEVLARVNTHLANQQMQRQLREARDELSQANARLEKRVRQRTTELEKANDELKNHREKLETLVEERTKDLVKFAKAVESSPISIIITDAFGTIEYANTKSFETSGYSQEEVLGQNPSLMKSDVHSRSFYEDMWDTILSGREWAGNICNRKKNGDLYWEHASISSIVDNNGKITHFVGVKEDITEQKRAEEKLIEAKEAAETATRAKSLFLANMSHEIRTPMNALIGLSHLALKTNSPPQQRDYLEKIRTASHSLLGIINDILDFSKIEADKVELENIAFKLSDITGQLQDTFALEARGKNLEFILKSPPDIPDFLEGDPMRLRQVLTNLVSNALKFTEKGYIRIEVSEVSHGPDQIVLRFSVCDSGIGLSQEQTNGIFDIFKQGDGTTTRRFGGTGLGLSICQRLVSLMGGKIMVKSKPGEGSEFYFEASFGIPEGNMDSYPPAPLDPSAPDLRGIRILLAEDNEINQEVALGLIEDTQADTIVVENGEIAVQKVKQEHIDLILMDVQMPIMDGLEATRVIREWESAKKRPSIPVIALSASVLEEDIKRTKEAGMDAHISKPIDPGEFYATLSSWIASNS